MAQNKSLFVAKSTGAGAGVAGLVGFTGLFAVGSILFITENYFGSLLFVSFALLAYVAGRDTYKIITSSFITFFSSRHLVARANYIEETLNPLRNQLQLNGNNKSQQEQGALPDLAVTSILLPNNPLAVDLKKLIQDGKGFDYLEY